MNVVIVFLLFFVLGWGGGGGEERKLYDLPCCLILFLTITGLPVTEEQLKEVAQHSGVLEIDDDFLEPEFRTKCCRIIPMPVEQHVEPAECAEAYKYLKRKFSQTV